MMHFRAHDGDRYKFRNNCSVAEYNLFNYTLHLHSLGKNNGKFIAVVNDCYLPCQKIP